MVLYGMVCYSMAWYSIVWYGMAWYGMECTKNMTAHFDGPNSICFVCIIFGAKKLFTDSFVTHGFLVKQMIHYYFVSSYNSFKLDAVYFSRLLYFINILLNSSHFLTKNCHFFLRKCRNSTF